MKRPEFRAIEAALSLVTIETSQTGGVVVESLLQTARWHAINLLVLGIHAGSGTLDLLRGNTTVTLAQKPICDVLGVH